MIVLALTMCAASTAARPTEPAPKTAMLDPARTSREFITQPAPVWIPQPNGASISSGSDLGTFTRFRSAARVWVANEVLPKKWPRTPPRNALIPSKRVKGRQATKAVIRTFAS